MIEQDIDYLAGKTAYKRGTATPSLERSASWWNGYYDAAHEVDRAEHAWRTTMRPGQVNHVADVPTAVVPRRRDIDATVTKCIDDYLLMERKARALDKLMENASPALRALIDDALVSSR